MELHPVNKKLTSEQIKNWRLVLTNMFGPIAMFLSEEDIEKFRDKVQADVDKLSGEEKES
jgi:hypothetical protein